jgi:hypothetical protein
VALLVVTAVLVTMPRLAMAARFGCVVGNLEVPVEAASLDAANESWARKRDAAAAQGNDVLFKLPCKEIVSPGRNVPAAPATPRHGGDTATAVERAEAREPAACLEQAQTCRARCDAGKGGFADKLAALKCRTECEVQRGACAARAWSASATAPAEGARPHTAAGAEAPPQPAPAAPTAAATPNPQPAAGGPAAARRNTQYSCGSASVDASAHATRTMEDARAEFRRRFEHEPACCAALDQFLSECRGRMAGSEVKQYACTMALDTSMFADWTDVYATSLADAHRQSGHPPNTDGHCVLGSAARQNEARDRKREHWNRLRKP